MIYADHAATTMIDPEAKEVWIDLQREYANVSQPYSFSRTARNILSDCRDRIAKCIGAKTTEIIITSGGSESNNTAIIGTMLPAYRSSSLVTSPIEHHSVLNTVTYVEQFGVQANYVKVSNTGKIDITNLSELMVNNPHLVSIMLANNEIGTIQPISSVSKICKESDCIVHTDAVQAIGHIPVNVNELGVDLLSASAHKFNGPKGIGFLYIREGTTIHNLIYGGQQEFKLRAGTENVSSIAAMCVALENNIKTMSQTTLKLNEYEKIIMDILTDHKIDYVRNGDIEHIPGNLSLSFKGILGETLLHRLDLMGIIVSTGSACDSKEIEISHVLNSINVESDYIQGTIRLSLGKENTRSEAEAIGETIAKIIKDGHIKKTKTSLNK